MMMKTTMFKDDQGGDFKFKLQAQAAESSVLTFQT
jgi:hypothetical protein